MFRRNFLTTIAAGLAASSGASNLYASGSGSGKTIAQLFLKGGPDFRHLIAPAYQSDSSTYGNQFWRAKAASFGVADSDSTLQSLSDSFLNAQDAQGQTFKINPIGDWLHQEYAQGRVAIINNVYGTGSRDHVHASRVFESGQHWVEEGHRSVSGWGGRVAGHKNENILSLTPTVGTFCYDEKENDIYKSINDPIISMTKSRTWGLYKPEELQNDPSKPGMSYAINRALQNYYRDKGSELDADSPYKILFQHESRFRNLGEAVQERLGSFGAPPFSGWESGTEALNNKRFQTQLSTLFDALLCKDILNTSMFSLNYSGFDTHKRQSAVLAQHFSDIFSFGGGLDQFFTQLRQHQPDVASEFVMVIGGEFGRQLLSNGDGGTDHGEGGSLILIGEPVQGGIYGDLFPQSELGNFFTRGTQIQGLTHFDRVFAKLSDWIEPNSSSDLFFNLDQSDLEAAEVLGFI